MRAAELAELARAWPEPAQDDAPARSPGSGRSPRARSWSPTTSWAGRSRGRAGTPRPCPSSRPRPTRWVDDSGVLVDLLRTMAAIGGPAVALGRYEAYRADLAERLGVDPAPELQHLHRELLAADDPVRTGLRYDGAGLLGREADLDPAPGRARVVAPGDRARARAASARPAWPRRWPASRRCRTCASSSWWAWAPATTWWRPSVPASACAAR